MFQETKKECILREEESNKTLHETAVGTCMLVKATTQVVALWWVFSANAYHWVVGHVLVSGEGLDKVLCK
jgi:hypothetical protein